MQSCAKIRFTVGIDFDTFEQRWGVDLEFQRRQKQLSRERYDMIVAIELGFIEGRDESMNIAERENKNAGFAPLTFFRGGGGDTLPVQHVPGYQEAGGDSSHGTRGRGKRPYSHKLATVKRDQDAATR